MIVDDSALLQQVLTEQPSAEGIEIIGLAADPLQVREALDARWPDVIVLQLGLSDLDGLAFLRQILNERPTPVVVSSPATEAGAELALDALSAGAVCAVTRPTEPPRQAPADLSDDLLHAVRAASEARVGLVGDGCVPMPATPEGSANTGECPPRGVGPVVVIGASAGGGRAIKTVLRALALFFVEGGAAINVASTIVPSRRIRPCSARWALIASKILRVSPCVSSRRLNFSRVVASGADSRDRSIPTKPRIA